MDPYSVNSDNSVGAVGGISIPPAFLKESASLETYYNSLKPSEYEAVIRCKDQFTSRKDVEHFIAGLRR